MFPKFLNYITLVPDNKPHIVTENSNSGWYILYGIDQNIQQAERSTPIPIYIYKDQQSNPKYLGWSTNIPTGCHGHSNFQTGFCQLIYQNFEDNLASQSNISSFGQQGTIDKTLNSIIGRILWPLLPEIPIEDNNEYYILYNRKNNCQDKFNCNKLPLVDPITLSTWKIGFLTYSEIASSAIIPTKVFGYPVEGTYRFIGLLSDYLKSHDPILLTPKINREIPKIIDTLPTIPMSVDGNSGNYKIFNPGETIYITFEHELKYNLNYFGILLTSDPNITINYSTPGEIKLSNIPNQTFSLDFSQLLFLTYPQTIKIICGNQIFENML
jgi:hypothetical protein